jgi:hypothetical protein
MGRLQRERLSQVELSGRADASGGDPDLRGGNGVMGRMTFETLLQ